MSSLDHRLSLAGSLCLTLAALSACSKQTADPAPARPSAEQAANAGAPEDPAAIAALASLPARRAIAGIAGFQTSSRIVFDAEPNRPHTLSAVYLFPERVRLCLSLEQDRRVERAILYRAGPHGFMLDERAARSQEISGEELSSVFRQTELRRALFLWPDGFAWGGEGDQRSAELGSLGRLVASVDEASRPVTMRSFDDAGNLAETLGEIRWQQQVGRQFPAHFTLSAGDQRIWEEDVTQCETALDYADYFFLPPDQRGADTPAPGEAPPPAIEAIDLPALWELRIALAGEAQASLQGARAAADAARTQWQQRGIAALEGVSLELDREGRPTAILLYAADAGSPPEQGWQLRNECPAWAMAAGGEASIDRAMIAALTARLAGDGRQAHIQLHMSAAPDGSERRKLVAVRAPR